MGKCSVFSLGPQIFPTKLLLNLGYFLLPPCAPPLGAIARYCCAVVGSPSVRHVRSSRSLGSEKLVIVENVSELGSSAKTAALFDSPGC